MSLVTLWPWKNKIRHLAWWLPLLAIIWPLIIAFYHTCVVPRADHWSMIIFPYFQSLDTHSWWNFFHSPGTDSRHNAPKLLHGLIMSLPPYHFLIESLICVGLGLWSVLISISFWRHHHDGPQWRRIGFSALSTIYLFSPMMWMNWSWGVQICYMLSIASTLLVIWVFHRSFSLWWRLGLGALAAAVATFSFINGWFAWGLGGLLLVSQALVAGEKIARLGLKVVVWIICMIITAAVYVMDWPEGKEIGEKGVAAHWQNNLTFVVQYFLRVLGAPFSELWFWRERSDRVAGQNVAAPLISLISLGLLVWTFVRWWSQRSVHSWQRLTPWLMMILWGGLNAAAISWARLGKEDFSPYQSRYPSFTLWFYLGLLGWMALVDGRIFSWVRRTWVVFLIWAWGVGAYQGWADSDQIARHTHLIESAVAMRHVAPEPVMLDVVIPGAGERVMDALNRFESLGLAQVPAVKSPLVSEAELKKNSRYVGKITEGHYDEKGLSLKGWAFDKENCLNPISVVLSYQRQSEPEYWFGVATKFIRSEKIAKKMAPWVPFRRVGWIYQPLTGQERTFMGQRPLELQRKKLPSGELIIRAYVMENESSCFYALDGFAKITVP